MNRLRSLERLALSALTLAALLAAACSSGSTTHAPVDLDPNSQGEALLRDGKADLALEAFDRAIEKNASSAQAHANRGRALLLLKRYDEASTSFDAAIHLDPSLAAGLTPFVNQARFRGQLTGRMAFAASVTADRNMAGQIFVMNADGSSLAPVTTEPAYRRSPAWSPDGSRIAFGEGIDIFTMKADGSDKVRLTADTRSNNSPAWSPDGQRLAFVSNRDMTASVYTMNADGSEVKQLHQGAQPDWSPDGSRIVFVMNTGSPFDCQIYVMPVDGSRHTQLEVSVPVVLAPVRWSPDGSRLLFTGVAEGFQKFDGYTLQNQAIYSYTLASGETKRLTNSLSIDTQGVFSPEGSLIAFVSNRGGKNAVYVMNADGSNPTLIAGLDSAWEIKDLDWQGERPVEPGLVAFVSTRDGNQEIYVMRPDGSEQLRLTNRAASDQRPVISPDGKRIAFVSFEGTRPSLFLMNADGSGLTRLSDGQAADHSPVWSPDGQRLAFVSNRDTGLEQVYTLNVQDHSVVSLGLPAAFVHSWSATGGILFQRAGRLYVANHDGTNARRITNSDGKPIDLAPTMGAADWSSDGKRIAYIAIPGPSSGTTVVKPSDLQLTVADYENGSVSRVRVLKAGAVEWSSVVWSPDSSRLLFTSNRAGNSDLYSIDVNTELVTRVTSSGGFDGDSHWSR